MNARCLCSSRWRGMTSGLRYSSPRRCRSATSPDGCHIPPQTPTRSRRRSHASSKARPRRPTRRASPVARRSECKRCRRPQTASAPFGLPRQTRHATDGSCRRPAKEPAPLARSSGHRRATRAHWRAEPTDASPTRRAPARSARNVHLATRSQGESCPQTNPNQPAWQQLFAFPMSWSIMRSATR